MVENIKKQATEKPCHLTLNIALGWFRNLTQGEGTEKV